MIIHRPALDFMYVCIKLKPFFSLYLVIIRPRKTINTANKNWAHIYKIKYFRNQSFQKIPLLQVGLLVL